MTDQIRRLYDQRRSEGLQAKSALAWAKSEVEVINLPYDGEDGDDGHHILILGHFSPIPTARSTGSKLFWA
jgi:hypothetical protein